MDKRCRNCKHFNTENANVYRYRGDLGVCDKEALGVDACEERKTFTLVCYHDGPVLFHKDFGCILFEAKE